MVQAQGLVECIIIQNLCMQLTSEDQIDLEYATCEMVNVSYALVSKNSISDYSPSLVQCVFGGE